MWTTSLLTIVLVFPLLEAAPLDIAGGVKDDNDGMHSHDENVTRQGKFFNHNQFDVGNINISGSITGDVVSIGHEVKIDVHGQTVIECKEGVSMLFKSIDSNENGLMDAKELLRVCHQHKIQITESLAVRILTLPDKTVGFNLAKFCELLKDCPSSNSADLIHFLLQLYDKESFIRVGDYENHLYDNGGKNNWHYVTITRVNEDKYKWTNKAGVSWNLYGMKKSNTLRVGEDCPYYNDGHREAVFNSDGVFGPENEFYKFKDGSHGSFDECQFKTCGELCETGVCDGDGFCVNAEENPCVQHGCGGKSCGDQCISGDIVGSCDIDGACDFDIDRAINSCDKQGKPWCKGRNYPGGKECCESEDPHGSKCTEGQGDCDSDDGCAGDLVCGKDNCRQYHSGASLEDDCCTKPDTPCTEPFAVPGPCKARLPRWSYNQETGICRPFLYGGCQGNNNNFHSKEDCATTCQISGKPWCKGRNYPRGKECCESEDPHGSKCTEGQGDCDSDDGCAGDLVCGKDNCRQYHSGASLEDDCCTKPGQVLPGGFSDLDVNDIKATSAAAAAVSTLAGVTGGSNPVNPCGKNINLVGVEKAEIQVVAGINYKLTLRLATHTGDDCTTRVEKVCEDISVWEKLPFMCPGDGPCHEVIQQENIKCKEALGKPWCKGRNYPGGKECCESEDPHGSKCTEGQGDCDSDDGCAGDLVCGKNNCRHYHSGASLEDDCCTKPEAPKQEGESCGPCFCPPTYSAGDCAEGLTCEKDEMIPDAPGICTRPGLVTKVKFNLFTGLTEEEEAVDFDGKTVTLSPSTKFDPSKPIKIVIHGWEESSLVNGEVVQSVIFPVDYPRSFNSRYKDNGLDYTVVGVYWVPLYGWQLPLLSSASSDAANTLALLLSTLARDHNISSRQLHFIGFSMGTVVTSKTAKKIQEMGMKPISRGTLLDPCFADQAAIISKSDGDFLEAIHTSSQGHCSEPPLAHVDFYVNGGDAQICGSSPCSCPDGRSVCDSCYWGKSRCLDALGLPDWLANHMRAPQLYIESIGAPEAFTSWKCSMTYQQFVDNGRRCAKDAGRDTVAMGEHSLDGGRPEDGLYFVETTGEPPFHYLS